MVTFLDGGNPIGTGALNGAGVASFGTTTLAVGTHILTATYPGTGALSGSTSAAVTETIIASAFNLSVAPSTLTLKAGQTGTVSLQLGSTGGYAGTLALGSGSLPAYTTGAFQPSTVELSANGNATATFTIATPVITAGIKPPTIRGGLALAGFAGFLLAPLSLLRRRRFASVPVLLLMAGLLFGLVGCSTLGDAIHTVKPGTYLIPVSVTDTNGNTKSASFSLVITL